MFLSISVAWPDYLFLWGGTYRLDQGDAYPIDKRHQAG